jgi:myo-inositol-1(or 4)-monophosphatase
MKSALRKLAVDLAEGAGHLLLDAVPTGQHAKTSPTDLVTDADLAAERYIVERLRAERPEDAIIAEEGSLHDGGSGITWVIDPLDGTINFVYGIPQWCVSIGVEGTERLGVIHDPTRRETFTDGDRFHPSQKSELSSALIGTGFSYSATTRARQAQVLGRVLPKVRDVRRAGSCALDLAWVACGRFDAFYEEDTHHWDISAGIAIVEAAGGTVRTFGSLTMAAGNADLLDQLERLVRQD